MLKKQGFRFSLQFTQCKEEAANNLLALKHNITCLSDWPIYRCQQSAETVTLSKLVMWSVQPIKFGW